jgi:N-methylhydantoinase A
VDTARRYPVRLVESGPAGGAILARAVAAENDARKAVAFDMGGTTAKLTLLDDLDLQRSRQFEVARAYRFVQGSGLPVRIPVIELVEIGAGGGSIARLDALGRIQVGPDSAGSAPGPACYGRGGTEPTVTDADTALGRLDPTRFAGGAIPLHRDKAEAALEALAGPLGADAQGAAAGVAEIVDETMASAARVHAVENGKDTADRTLIAFGGAAPLHAARLARKLGMKRVIVPVGAGVGSAFGFLRASIAYEVVRTRHVRLDMFEAKMLNELFAIMRTEAETVVRPAAPGETLVETRQAFMRYRGQGHEIAVPLPNQPFNADAAGDLRRRFEATYEQVFGRAIPKLEVEALTWTLSIGTERPLPPPARPVAKRAAPASAGHREVFDPASGLLESAALHERRHLEPGVALDGPALIVEDGTTTVVPNGFIAQINELGQIVLEDRA